MSTLNRIEKLEDSKEFKTWKKDHEKSYLVHAFVMNDQANANIPQIGYFDPETRLISVFVVADTITKNEDAEVFQEQKKLVNKLDLEKVKITEVQATETANKFLQDEYKVQSMKSFMILQNLDNVGQVWNVTYVTNQFKTVNIKVDAATNEIKEHKEVSLIQE